jgi:HPt (histidine-containing phosphotransfer) domain-containing protein
MITTRAKNLTALIERTHELEQSAAHAESFQATTAAVVELADRLQELADDARRVVPRLGPASRIEVRRTFESVGEQLHQIRLQLRSNPRQTNEVSRLEKQVVSAAVKLEVCWRSWCDLQLQPHRDALALVSFLPEIQAQQNAIDQALQLAGQLSLSLPKSDESLRSFKATVETLGSVLAELEGISITVKSFLDKVVNGQATIEDLDPEILAWVQQRGRAKAFKIGFQMSQERSRAW